MSQLDSGVAAVQHCADRDDSQPLAGVWVGAPAYSSGGWRAVFAADSGHRILLLGKGPAPIPGAQARQLVRTLATGDGQRAWLLRSRLCGMARVHRVLELDAGAAPSLAQAPQVALAQAPQVVLAQAPQVALAKLRLRLSERLRQLTGDTDAGAVLRAVTLGEGSGVRRELWQQFQATGTVHLLVISGLHLGLVALVGGLLAGWCLRWLAPALLLVRPLQDWRWLAAWLSGFTYACLAGFAVSAQRALVMLALALLLLLSRQRTASPLLSLLLALALLLTWDPLAVLAPGLWLSFAGVAILLLYGASASASSTDRAQGAQVGGWASLSALLSLLAVAGRRLRLFAGVQIAISVALAAPLLLSAIAPSPLSLPANLLAVPLLGMGTVPLGLAGLLLLPVPALAAWPLELATLAAALALSWIEVLATAGRALAQSLGWAQPVPVWPTVLLASLAALLLLAPPGFPMRRLWPVLLLCLPLSAFWTGRGDAVLVADAGLELHLHSRGRDFAGELHFAGRRLHIRSDWRGLTFATDDRQRYGCFAVRWQVAELSLQTRSSGGACLLQVTVGGQSLLLSGRLSKAVAAANYRQFRAAGAAPGQYQLLLAPQPHSYALLALLRPDSAWLLGRGDQPGWERYGWFGVAARQTRGWELRCRIYATQKKSGIHATQKKSGIHATQKRSGIHATQKKSGIDATQKSIRAAEPRLRCQRVRGAWWRRPALAKYRQQIK